MGSSFSCPGAEYTDFESSLKSVNLEDGEVKRSGISCSFENQDSSPLKNKGSVRVDVSSDKQDGKIKMPSESPRSNSILEDLEPGSRKHNAATKIQKVYKSFRTRRKLADCAVQVEQSWRKLLNYSVLKFSSISFFDHDRQETTVSRWFRARARAAMVGKGLSKNDKAQKLAVQHWLEAIDPKHRYGHNLQFYHESWSHTQRKEPFFYRLDIGEGKGVDLIEDCPRSKLQQQRVKYLGPLDRKEYEVVIMDGKLLHKQTGRYVDTSKSSIDSKWIFVLSTSRTLYVALKVKGLFHHSSFLAGGATLAAGTIASERGVLKAIWPHSGHYRPTQENFQGFIAFLQENHVDTTHVKIDPDEDDIRTQNNGLHIKGTNPFGERQLASKWSTGAGPRLRCLRDCAIELQSHALKR